MRCILEITIVLLETAQEKNICKPWISLHACSFMSCKQSTVLFTKDLSNAKNKNKKTTQTVFKTFNCLCYEIPSVSCSFWQHTSHSSDPSFLCLLYTCASVPPISPHPLFQFPAVSCQPFLHSYMIRSCFVAAACFAFTWSAVCLLPARVALPDLFGNFLPHV